MTSPSLYSPEPLDVPSQVIKKLPTSVSCCITEKCDGRQSLILTFEHGSKKVIELAKTLTAMRVQCTATKRQLTIQAPFDGFLNWLDQQQPIEPNNTLFYTF